VAHDPADIPSLESRIEHVRAVLLQLTASLRRLGYQFDRADRVMPGPEPQTPEAVARIEREVGPVPAALTLFWKRIGSVDFSGHHPSWSGCEYPDPLIVYPPSVAIAELDEFLSDREEREKSNFPYCIPIAPDALHKADVSGGMWLNIDVPASADDPSLNESPDDMTFLAYLEFALEWGGFPGLRGSTGHTWPMNQITAAN
jgi:hypothetical protein